MTGPTRRGAAHATRRRGLVRSGFAVPALVLLGALTVYPLVVLVTMSLSRVTFATVNRPWPAVGLANFTALAAGPDLVPAAGRTALFVAVVTVLGTVGGLAVAVALRRDRRRNTVLLAAMVFVWALPPVVNGSVWKFLLSENGLVNAVVRSLGGAGPVPFLFDPDLALVSVAFVNSWAVIPFNALVFRAALLGIDPSVLEAAALDGAGRWQEIRHVLVPAARSTAVVLAVLTVVYAFRSFDFVYVMTAGGPGTATTTLPFLGYVQAFVARDLGTGAATSLLSLAVVAVLAVVYIRIVRRETA